MYPKTQTKLISDELLVTDAFSLALCDYSLESRLSFWNPHGSGVSTLKQLYSAAQCHLLRLSTICVAYTETKRR